MATDVFSWEDDVEITDQEFEPLPDGDYEFEITNFEREWYEPKGTDAKLPACNQACLELTIGNHKVFYRLQLAEKLKWKVCQLFESVGLRKKGDGLGKLPWGDLVSKKGICEIGHREYNGKVYNEVKQCYPPEKAPKLSGTDTNSGGLTL